MASQATDPHETLEVLPGHSKVQAWRPLNFYGHMTPERTYTPLSARDPSNAWTYVGQSSSRGRISPPRDATPSLPASTMPPRSTSGDQSRGLHESDHVRRASMTGRIGDSPLVLHIPDRRATLLPRLGTSHADRGHETMLRPLVVKDVLSGLSSAPMALPSFASLHEATQRDAVSDDKSGLDAMADRSRCDNCLKAEPLVKDAVIAVAELHDAVQEHCSRSSLQRPEVPDDASLRTFQWIIDNLRYAKSDLLEARRETARCPDLPLTSQDSKSRKRPAEFADSLDIPLAKRYRAVSMGDAQRSLPSIQTFAREQSSYAEHYSKESGRPDYSSPPNDSLPASAYPRHPSPTYPSQWHQPPPSPMSLAYAPSVGPALTVTSAQSSHSPTSPHHLPSLLGSSTSSAASQHIADLQHQITLKSLSLQTLQGEYSSMLQKFQRERVKNQAIEKKASVAEQEINDLTTRNDDLADQVKSLETSLTESEKKRDSERADIGKEREQWGRMLDLGGRLQAKNAIDRQRLFEQVIRLEQRLQSGDEGSGRSQSGRQSPDFRTVQGASSSVTATMTSAGGFGLSRVIATDESPNVHGFVVMAAQRENLNLKARIDVLRFALEELSRQSLLLQAQEREATSARAKMDEAVQRALNEDDAMQRPHGGAPIRLRAKASAASSPRLSTISEPRSRSASDAARAAGTSRLIMADLPSAEEMGRMTRVESPSAADLGITDRAASASPEELMKALGPAPKSVPLPSWHPPPSVSNPASRNKQREPFGPSTPYPGMESTQWRAFAPSEHQNRSPPVTSRRSSLSHEDSGYFRSRAGSSASQAPALSEQSTPQAPAHSVSSSLASMLPPPRPAATGAQIASWRPS
ncbi:hypothetical protein B0A48_13261 [Cryoendolithus antarcticus]|uniref:Uncharacterized protein n=1 Tax=Cryoendolithus antarcticus TaxID=1507870 RepID=A0A1V8SPR3_9PEZI|nr:hypothetical protein B0A48_13261 [Cryoendolithus antarcticus]